MNFSVIVTTKLATSVVIDIYTNNANKISNLVIAYIVIEPLFAIYDFYTCWLKPNVNFWNGQNSKQIVNGVGPFASTTQSIWTAIVGV